MLTFLGSGCVGIRGPISHLFETTSNRALILPSANVFCYLQGRLGWVSTKIRCSLITKNLATSLKSYEKKKGDYLLHGTEQRGM